MINNFSRFKTIIFNVLWAGNVFCLDPENSRIFKGIKANYSFKINIKSPPSSPAF